MNEPITQAQDHDRRIGRLEGIFELLAEQGRQTNARFDRMDQAISEVRQEIAAQGRCLDSLTRWLVGIQIASLIAIGSLLFSILNKLP